MNKKLLLVLSILGVTTTYGATVDKKTVTEKLDNGMKASLEEVKEKKEEKKAISGTFNQQFQFIDRDRKTQQLEMTLAKGSIKLKDRVRLDYDVDKDIFLDKDGNKTGDGLDTSYGLAIDSGSYNGWNLENYFGMEWDSKEKRVNGKTKMRPKHELYYWAPRVTKKLTDKTTFELDPRLNFQKKPTYDKGTDVFGEVSLTFDTDLGSGWSNTTEFVNWFGKSLDTNGGDYQFDPSTSFTYKKNFSNGFYFTNESGLEIEGLANSKAKDEYYIYNDTEIGYKAKLSDKVTLTPYVSYELGHSEISGSNDDEYQEFATGIKLGTKF